MLREVSDIGEQNGDLGKDMIPIPGGTFAIIPTKRHLIGQSDCRHDRPAARHIKPIDTSTSHVGFRCVLQMPMQ